MSLSAGTVSIGVKSDTTGFGRSLHNSLIGEIGGIGKGLGEAIVAGAALVLGVGMKEAMDSEKINAQFAAGIKSTGNAANLSVKSMDELAGSIAGYSGQSYASIGTTEQLLQTFVNIKNTGVHKTFDQATVAAADMAAKMGGDASGMAIKLGKALNDPVKGMTALGRVGVQFTQSQKDSIAAMVKHGDTAGAQQVILKELSKEFGGAAKAAGETLPGQLNRSKVAFGELSKSVVETILPIITPAIQGLAGEITKATPGIKAFAKSFSEDLKNAITTVSPALKEFGSWIAGHKPLVIGFGVAAMGVALAFKVYEGVMATVKVATASWAVVQAVGTATMFLWNAVVGTSIGETLALKAMYLGSAIATGVMTAAQWLLNVALTANPIGLVVVAVGALIGAIVAIATKTTWFQTIWEYTSHAIGSAWKALWNGVLQPVVHFILEGFTSIASMIGKVLVALGNIPGFGWAKTAGQLMLDAADGAKRLADGIKQIPDHKQVTIGITWDIPAMPIASVSGAMRKTLAGHNAGGTDNWRGGPTWVNEKGGEIIDLPSGSRIIPADKSAKMMEGNGGGGDVVTTTIVKLDGRVLFQEMQRQSIAYARRNGTSGLMV